MSDLDFLYEKITALEGRVKLLEDKQDPRKYNCDHVWSIHNGTAGHVRICKRCGRDESNTPNF